MTLQEIQYKAQSIIHKWRDDDSAPYVEFVEELAHMIVPEPSISGSSEIPNDHDEHVPEIKETGTQGLDEAAKAYALDTAEDSEQYSARYLGYKDGAKWQKEQDDKELSEKIAAAYQIGIKDKEQKSVEGLNEAASNAGFDYVDDIVLLAEPNHRWNDHDVEQAYSDGFKAGAEWRDRMLNWVRDLVQAGIDKPEEAVNILKRLKVLL